MDEVEAPLARLHEAAGLGHVHGDVFVPVRMAGEVAEAPLDQLDHLRVELDRVDRAGAPEQPEQHVRPAAGAQDQGFRLFQQVGSAAVCPSR